MAYIKQSNPKVDARFDSVGSEYMRHGEALGVRWDYAFFQMILETGYLAYTGDVKADQNNFAGLGATGKGARGESFPDVSTGVRAHMEHLVLYSGERVENPVAERTRNVQEWGVLTNWQKEMAGPITFGDLAKKWAPTSRRYGSDMQAIAERFFNGLCLEPDPATGLVAAAGAAAPVTAGQEARQRAVDAAPAATTGGTQLAALGAPPASESQIPTAAAAQVAAAASEAKAEAKPKADATAKAEAPPKVETAKAEPAPKAETPAKAQPQTAAVSPPIKLLNPAPAATEPAASKAEAPAAGSKAEAPASTSATAKTEGKNIEVAALPSGALKETAKTEKKEPAASGKCRVWTASYGGTKAIIIKAVRDKTVNYTVLDVNEGAEKRETDAYINAYAKGGESVGEFPSQSQALEKAFELCPEG